MSTTLQEAAGTILGYTGGRAGGVPGVVARATDTNSNFYEGTAGVREPGKYQAMTCDTVFAIFSSTKAITGTTLMQLVEEGC